MLKNIFSNFFKKKNDRIISQIKEKVKIINDMEPKIEKLSNEQLRHKTYEFKKQIKCGININEILPEAFAVVREASKRIFGMRHFDVQLIGGIVLNNFCIAEMRTGEGKTLTSTLPAYLNALIGRGVHIVTVNDYLAKRDAENNRQLFEFLGLTVGINLPGLSKFDKRSAYLADITYGTNNEYGFDYLRDNMIFNPEDRVQRELYFALIDEIDSILIDEARTPLVISGSSEDYSDLYKKINKLIPFLIRQEKEDSENFQGTGHFSIDEKSKQVNLTERGLILIEKLLVKFNFLKKEESLYSSKNIVLIQHIISALRAHVLFFRNVDYIVKDNTVVIVDDHTGRTLPGRRWSDGLHQALEAKENVFIHNENQTLASITFQNYFRLYKKLAGMTGTAATESFEFESIYKLDTIVIPTNRPMIRKDFSDLVYITEKEKINAIIQDIKKCVERKQPVLVGTISIEKSEIISNLLKKENIKHNILNAKFHAIEAEIIAQAGQPGAVTIATNMAGRGTDIVLGGNWKNQINSLKGFAKKEKICQIKRDWKKNHEMVLSVGGLHVIGTERHESRRIDNQLRGRSGRQGDIGSSRFYVSMEDSLMRIFASEKISFFMRRFGMKFGEAIEHPLITKAIANAQKKVENRNFDIRKQLLEYDDVANIQRLTVYKQRNELLDAEDISDFLNNIRRDVIEKVVFQHIVESPSKEKDQLNNLVRLLNKDFSLDISLFQYLDNLKNVTKEKILSHILYNMDIQYQRKKENLNKEFLKNLEKNIVLKNIDTFWKEHLLAMEFLRQGIHLRGYAQKDPKEEYKRESFLMFSSMIESLKYEIISSIYRM